MAKDPYKYFRVEARELVDGMQQGILQLEKGSAAPEVIVRLLRLAHTLKGAARVVRQPEIAELSHTAEGILTTYRESGQPLSKEQGSELLRLLDKMDSLLSVLDAGNAASATGPVRLPPVEPLETLRVEIREMDGLLHAVTEAGVQLGTLRNGLGAARRLRDLTKLLQDLLIAAPAMKRANALAEELQSDLDHFQGSLAVDLERVDGAVAEIRDLAHRLRLIPAHTVFPSLDRSVRDAAETLGKRVDFVTSGGDVRLDADVLASLRDALMHVVRNAVAHGLETEAERIGLGKSPIGQVRLEIQRRGGRVSFRCTDDGRGIDVEAVRRAAVARGLVPASEAGSLSSDKVLALLRTVGSDGLSTSNDVTELSGRGIGLDVVRATTSRLKGELSIRSETGLGATVEIQVPISIASLHGLVIEAAGSLATIPLDAVRQTLRVRDSDIARSAQSDSIVNEGRVIPFVPLDRLLQRPSQPGKVRHDWLTVVVQAGDRRVAVGVDRLLGTSNIVMRPLPAMVNADSVVAGASVNAEGDPQLVLDPDGLVAAADRGRGTRPQDAAQVRAPVLIIDDSLTTRMLEQSILESAGYEVEIAVSAEEGLTKAHARGYSLFIVDVDMPGMDGFEFVTLTRADPALRDIPAILVTSRDAAEDRRRGEQAGARGYIVKGEFDQGQLLKNIRTLIG